MALASFALCCLASWRFFWTGLATKGPTNSNAIYQASVELGKQGRVTAPE